MGSGQWGAGNEMKRWVWDNKSYSKSQMMVAAVLLLLLPLLALMQYRLLGKVSEGERERLRASLLASATRFSADFDQEVVRIYSAFLTTQTTRNGAGAMGGREEQLTEMLNSAYGRWHDTTAYPRLVEGVYLARWTVPAGGGDEYPELTRLTFEPGREGGLIEPVEWPTGMAELRGLLADRDAIVAPRRENGGGGTGLLPMMALDNGQPLLLFQLVDAPGAFPGAWNERDRGNPGPPAQKLAGLVIVSINLSYLQQDLLPNLARSHFIAGDRQHFDLAVASQKVTDRAIWLSEAVESKAGSPGWRFNESDLSVRLFTLRSDLLRQQLRRWRPAVDGPPPSPAAPRLAIIGGRLVFSDELLPLWNLHLRHHSGSLDVAVATARRTNLAISLVILTLLTASFGLMMVSSIRARRLAREQMNFVAGISHELRTPLAVIDSAGYNLSRGFVTRPEATREYGAMIRNECHRLGEMVEQVLDFATFRSGRQIFNHLPTVLTEIIEESVRASQPLLDEGGFTVEQQLPARQPGDAGFPLVMADRQAMIRALRNLLSNAMKYGGDDRWIGLKVATQRRGRHEFVSLTVSDHGIGIPREDLSRIFEPFYRSSDVRTAQIQGNGLGLSLVRNIVEAHHGTISVESQVGRGTSFTITLPVATPPALTDTIPLLTGTEVTTR